MGICEGVTTKWSLVIVKGWLRNGPFYINILVFVAFRISSGVSGDDASRTLHDIERI